MLADHGGNVAQAARASGLAVRYFRFVKARNRVYQYRNRGRKAGCGALTALVGEGRLGPDDIEHAVRILGCDVHHGEPEKGKGALS